MCGAPGELHSRMIEYPEGCLVVSRFHDLKGTNLPQPRRN